jgi:hypothetical protein
MGAARVHRVGAIQLAYYHRVDTPKRRICRSALREQLISRASLRAAEIHVPRAARAAAAPGLRVRGWVERLRSEASGTAVVYRTERKADLYFVRGLNVRGRATAVVGRRRSPPFGRFERRRTKTGSIQFSPRRH